MHTFHTLALHYPAFLSHQPCLLCGASIVPYNSLWAEKVKLVPIASFYSHLPQQTRTLCETDMRTFDV